MNLSVSILEKIQESKKVEIAISQIIDILLAAINDWPIHITYLVEYENEVHKLLGENITKKVMDEYISNIDYSKNAWEGESLSQLIEVFNYYNEGKELKEIFRELHNEIE